MRRFDGAMTRGLLAALAALLLAALLLVPGSAAVAQVTCPSAANDETLNITTTGGVTTCTNIGTAAATEGIEIRNNLEKDYDPLGPGLGGERFGVSFRRITTGGNEQPTAAGCVGYCVTRSGPNDSVDPDGATSSSTSSGFATDWGYGTGATTMVSCVSGLAPYYGSCTVSFQFSDGTSGAFTVAGGSTVIPSFSLGGTVALPPGITSVTPSVVPRDGTQQVVVQGSNFDTLTSVVLNVTPQTFQIISSSEIRFNASDFNVGTVLRTLTLTNPGGTATASMTITPALVSIDTATLPSGALGASYSAGIAVSGGTRSVSSLSFVAYSYAATGLPTGLSINSSGVISGQPTQAGTFIVTVTVTDPGFDFGNGVVWPVVSKSKTLTLAITPAVTVTTASLAAGTVGAPYTAPLAASGGTAPYTFTATGLPTGLTVSGASITGTPTEAGTFTVNVTATDATTPTALVSAAVPLSLVIAQGAQTVAFTSTPPASPAPGTTYTVTATGGASGNPVVFSIDPGSTAGACSISGAVVSFTGAGTCLINANQAGNANYAAASQVQQTITVAKIAQTVSFTSTPLSPSQAGTTYAVTATGGASGNPVTFAIDPGSTAGACTVSGSTVTLAAPGTCLVNANQAGNATYDAGTAQQSITIANVTPQLSVLAGSGQSVSAGSPFANPLRLRLVDQSTGTRLAGWTVNFAGPSLDGPTAFLFSGGTTAIISGTTDASGEFTFTATANAFVGSYAITAFLAGSNTISFSLTNTATGVFTATAGSTPQSAQVNADFATAIGGTLRSIDGNPLAGVTVTFSGPGSGATAFLFQGASTTGVAHAVTDGSGSFALRARANNLIGSYVIRATIPGVGTFDYALTNTGIPQTIAFTSTPPNPGQIGSTYTVTATGGASGNPVTFALGSGTTSGACTLAGAVVSFASPGTCVINANQAGTTSYLAAAQMQQSITVGQKPQTIAFSKPADLTYVPSGTTVALAATATSGLAVTFVSTTQAVCTVSGTTATIVGAGTCAITAKQAGDATWLAAPDVAQSFGVGKASQTITFTKPAGLVFKAGATVALQATASSGLAVTFTSESAPVCTVSAATATIVAAGTCTIRASQAGNTNYAAAPDVTVSFGVASPPVVTATATVAPTTFSRPGETLTFSITLANAGGVAATAIRLVEPRLAGVSCAATSIAAGGTLLCRGTTTTTVADLSAGRVSITPQLTYTYAGAAP